MALSDETPWHRASGSLQADPSSILPQAPFFPYLFPYLFYVANTDIILRVKHSSKHLANTHLIHITVQ